MPNKARCSVFLVGAQSRLIQCGLVLLEKNHEILGVVSADPAVKQWANQKNLPHLSPDSDYVSVMRRSPFDLLLSIDNPIILPAEALGLARKFSINFHDGPLPRYAGVNVTDWAILNRETTHGVTWHEMLERLDAGDILKQRSFPVSATETAFTLNAKCFEASIQSFSELVDEIAEDRVLPIKQDLKDRTYFGLWKRPEGNCTIDWNRSAEEIDALVRGMNHGPYENPLGLPKIYLGDRIVIAKELEILESKSASAPGAILFADADRLQVATAGQDVNVRGILSLEGIALSPLAVLEASGLHVGDSLPQLQFDQLQRVSQIHKELSRHESFWASRLQKLAFLDIPFKTRQLEAGSRRYLKAHLPLSQQPFQSFSAQQSPGDLVLAASLLYFSRISGNSSFDVDFQNEELFQRVSGSESFFASRVPLHADLEYEAVFGEFFKSVEKELDSVRTHGSYPRDLPLRVPSLRSTLTQQREQSVPIAFERPKQISDREPDSNCDLLVIIPDDGLECLWLYDAGLFEETAIARMQQQFATLWEEIGRIGSNSSQKIGELSLLSPAERQQVLVDWNATGVAYPRNVGLHELIEIQADHTPDLEALRFRNHSLTYSELNSRANQVAHYLRSRGVGQDVLVGVCMERSIEMVIALLASLKAGGAYMPLDPEYPAERLRVVLEEANPPVVLTQAHLLNLVPATKADCLCLDTDWELVAGEPASNLEIEVRGKDVAYAIFTSGSTGKPKGVLNVHEGIVNRLLWMQDAYSLHPGDRVLQKTPFSFDVSVWEFFWPLMTGATMVVAEPGGHRDPNYLLQLIKQERISTMHFVPSMLQMFLEAQGVEECTSLKKVFASGEALPYEVQKRFFERLHAELHNLYGPTEAAVDVTYWECQRNGNNKIVPIGRPIANTQIVILDASQHPVPVGVAGELHIGGVNLARGYLNRPDLTAEKFVPNPFPELDTDRLYRTGDLARFLPDGNVEYLGRLDHQVKIRGFRIELGEIENALSAVPGVMEAVVIAREDTPGDKRLVAYYTTSTSGEIELQSVSTEQFRTHLSAGLPEFMVPAAFVRLDSFPLSSNGKLDRKALPAPADEAFANCSYEAPGDEAEQMIAAIWQEELGVARVGRSDNFYDLGGDSLRLMKVQARLRQAFNKDIAMLDLFRFTTVRALAQNLVGNSDASAPEIVHADGGLRKKAVQRQRQLRQQVANELSERPLNECA